MKRLKEENQIAISDVKVKKIMTKNVITASENDIIVEAVRKMVKHNIECLPIVNGNGILLGLVTFRDVVLSVIGARAHIDGTRKKRSRVQNIMSTRLVTCSPNSTILEVTKLMNNRHLRRIPVVDSENKLLGIVTDFDMSAGALT
jgi:CBS domain-containing protein